MTLCLSIFGTAALVLLAGSAVAAATGKGRGVPGRPYEFASVNFWSDKAQDEVDAGLDRRQGKVFSFLAGPSWVERGRRTTIPVFACQGGASSDFRRGSLGAQGRILLVDLDRGGLLSAPIGKKNYSRETARSPQQNGSSPVESGFGSACSQVDLAKLFPSLLQRDGFYRVLAIHPGGLAEGFDLKVGKVGGGRRKSSNDEFASANPGKPMPPDAWAVDEAIGDGAIEFSMALDTSAGNSDLRASVPLGAANGVRNVHVAGMDRSGRFAVWTLVLPATEKRSRFRLDLARLFPSVRASGGLVLGIWEGGLTGPLLISPVGPQGSEP